MPMTANTPASSKAFMFEIKRLSWQGVYHRESQFKCLRSRVTGKVPAVLTFSTAALRPAISLADLFSAVRTAWPAARSAHSFLKFRAYSLNVLSSRFRSLHGDNPADPLIAREWRNVLPFCPCDGIGNENLSQIRRYIVYCARGDRFLAH